MKEARKKPLVLTVSFSCLYAPDFEVQVELVDENRSQGLKDAWNKAIEHYCPNDVLKMQRQLKRKLGSIYNFDDLSDVELRWMGENGKRDEVRANTDYAII